MFQNLKNWVSFIACRKNKIIIIFLFSAVFTDLTDDENLVKLCQKLKEKHTGEPVIFFIDENDISSMGNLPTKLCLNKLDDFYVISAISPISENYVRTKSSGFDFNEKDICVEDENCLWINLHLRYRNSSVIQNLCRNVGLSMREDLDFLKIPIKR